MVAIKIERFEGIAPRADPQNLRQNQAQKAENCRLFSGAIEPWNESLNSDLLASAPETIYKYSSSVWLQWAAQVDVVKSPVPDDQFGRVYWTGDGDPKMGVAGVIDSVSPYPTDSYTLGIVAPTTKLGGTIIANPAPPAGADVEQKQSIFYVYTYVSAYGEEGPPSPPSDEFEPDETEIASLSNIADPGAGDHNIVTKRIYRTLNGEYVFVADIAVAETVFDDDITDINTGGVIVSENWYSPSSTMKGLISLPNGIFAGFKGNEVRMSEPFFPHAWPPEYSLSVDYPIVGLAKIGSAIVILTTGYPYIAHGVHPDGYSLEMIETDQACVSKKSIVETGSHVLYASPDGLVSISGGAKVITEMLLKRREWQLYNPSSITGVYHDQRYYGFYDASSLGGQTAGFTLDPNEPAAGLTELSDYTTCVYSDLEEDAIYYTDSNSAQIKIWDKGVTLKVFTWKSKVFVTPSLTNFGWLQIRANAYPVNFDVFADGASILAGTINDNEAIRLPAGFLSDEWEIQIDGSVRVKAIYIAESSEDLRRT